MLTFADDKIMQQKWNAFVRKIDTETDNFHQVLRIIKTFLLEPFTDYLNETNNNKKWIASKLSGEKKK